jgi:hypothetical protein
MAIVENKATEIGDVILIKADAAVIGLIALQSFADTTVGETGSRFFTKEFRYSFNGLTWSDWIILTIPNVQAVPIVATDVFHVEYRYTRAGTDYAGELEFQEVIISGDTTAVNCGEAFNNSIFKEYFDCDDIDVLNWAINVLEKMYNQGIVPNYIIRGEDNKQRQDEDYVAYWFSVTTFFAFLVRYGREFENFYANTKLVAEYVRQKGLFICENDTLLGIQEIMNNMLRQYRQRGGVKMYETIAQSGNEANGELLRLVCYDPDTEFILGVTPSNFSTWCLDNTSPSYQGIGGSLHLVKGYEWTEDMLSVTPYPTVGSVTANVTDGTKKVLQLGAGGGIGDATENPAKSITINPNFNYEISFLVKTAGSLTLGCLAWDASNTPVSMIGMDDGASDSYFFQGESMNISSEWYFVRGILWNASEGNSSETTNLGVGKNLRFNANAVKIQPIILSAGGTVLLHNVKVKPVSLNYSHSYLDQGRWIDAIFENNNGELTDDQVEEQMRRKFIPYNTSFHNIYL